MLFNIEGNNGTNGKSFAKSKHVASQVFLERAELNNIVHQRLQRNIKCSKGEEAMLEKEIGVYNHHIHEKEIMSDIARQDEELESRIALIRREINQQKRSITHKNNEIEEKKHLSGSDKIERLESDIQIYNNRLAMAKFRDVDNTEKMIKSANKVIGLAVQLAAEGKRRDQTIADADTDIPKKKQPDQNAARKPTMLITIDKLQARLAGIQYSGKQDSAKRIAKSNILSNNILKLKSNLAEQSTVQQEYISKVAEQGQLISSMELAKKHVPHYALNNSESIDVKLNYSKQSSDIYDDGNNYIDRQFRRYQSLVIPTVNSDLFPIEEESIDWNVGPIDFNENVMLSHIEIQKAYPYAKERFTYSTNDQKQVFLDKIIQIDASLVKTFRNSSRQGFNDEVSKITSESKLDQLCELFAQQGDLYSLPDKHMNTLDI